MAEAEQWRVEWSYVFHAEKSPHCAETCGRGQVPLETKLERNGVTYHAVERSVDDIVSASGGHVVCLGHDYDDSGSMAYEIAAQIVAEHNGRAALMAEVERLAEALEAAEYKLYQCSVGHGVADHRNYPCDLPGEARIIMIEALRASRGPDWRRGRTAALTAAQEPEAPGKGD